MLAGLTASSVASLSGWALGHNGAGPVSPPEAPPALSLTLDSGAASTLAPLLADKVTGLQLMFTSCQATCPIQGALFAEAAKKLTGKSAQLLSISIDPGQDTPEKLREWLNRFGRSDRWRAARPNPKELDAFVAFLKSKLAGPDPHTAQVYYFNRQGKLVLRSADFPPASDIVKTLELIAPKR